MRQLKVDGLVLRQRQRRVASRMASPAAGASFCIAEIGISVFSSLWRLLSVGFKTNFRYD